MIAASAAASAAAAEEAANNIREDGDGMAHAMIDASKIIQKSARSRNQHLACGFTLHPDVIPMIEQSLCFGVKVSKKGDNIGREVSAYANDKGAGKGVQRASGMASTRDLHRPQDQKDDIKMSAVA